MWMDGEISGWMDGWIVCLLGFYVRATAKVISRRYRHVIECTYGLGAALLGDWIGMMGGVMPGWISGWYDG